MNAPTRYYQLNPPTARSPRPAPSTHVPAAEGTSHAYQFPPTTDKQWLSKAEHVTLAMLMSRAFKEFLRLDPEVMLHAKNNGTTKKAIEDTFRHAHCKYATSHPEPHPAGIIHGLSEARRAHFERLAAHFCKLTGEDLEAFRHTMRDGRAPGRAGHTRDQQSDLRQALSILAKEQRLLEINDAYIASIIASKFHQRTLGTLTRNEVWQVIFTIRNRAKTRDEGASDTRNKSQTKAYRAKKAAAKS